MCYSLSGDFMRTDIIYNNETLLIYLEGRVNKKEMNCLKKKMYDIINTYQINDVVLDMKNIVESNDLCVNNLLREYNSKFNNEIIVKK